MALIDFFINRNHQAHLHTHHNQKTNKNKHTITKIMFYFNHISKHLISSRPNSIGSLDRLHTPETIYTQIYYAPLN